MPPDFDLISTYFVLALCAFVAGAMNSIAGGGTLLTFPALTGVMAPAFANATSTLALLPGSIAGVSLLHCSLMLHAGQAFVQDHSRYGSYLNDERVESRAILRVGDRLRLGNPGVELTFVRMD